MKLRLLRTAVSTVVDSGAFCDDSGLRSLLPIKLQAEGDRKNSIDNQEGVQTSQCRGSISWYIINVDLTLIIVWDLEWSPLYVPTYIPYFEGYTLLFVVCICSVQIPPVDAFLQPIFPFSLFFHSQPTTQHQSQNPNLKKLNPTPYAKKSVCARRNIIRVRAHTTPPIICCCCRLNRPRLGNYTTQIINTQEECASHKTPTLSNACMPHACCCCLQYLI